jgi:hypothetical protein
MPISTFPRHDDYEDQFLLKPAGLRDTHSEGKVISQVSPVSYFLGTVFRTADNMSIFSLGTR